MRHMEKTLMLSVLDSQWKDHLVIMDHMRQSIHLRGYAQKDPKQEYKREAFILFRDLLDSIKREVIATIVRVQFRSESDVEALDRQWRGEPKDIQYTHADAPHLLINQTGGQGSLGLAGGGTSGLEIHGQLEPEMMAVGEGYGSDSMMRDSLPYTRQQPKVGRNEACPCGSGKKYKQCHGKLE